MFINECNKAFAYYFGQMASYDLGHVAKVSNIVENIKENFINLTD